MFSGFVKLEEINDFINPSQSCVKSIIETKTAKISLADCLACNGCITAAETLLIEEHSVENFLHKSSKKFIVLSISNQSLASFVSYLKTTPQNIINQITNLLNPSLIIDYNPFVQYALKLSYQEFKQKLVEKKKLLCSECPGWVCYSEKKVDQNIIQHLSRVKSPQQIFGLIIRKILTSVCQLDNKQLCIATIMPCFDKKLESVRNFNEVDCVMCSNEVKDFLLENNAKLMKSFCNNNCYYTFDSLIEAIIQWKKENMTVSFPNFLTENTKCLNENMFFNYSMLYPFNNYSSNGYIDYFINQLQLDYPTYSINILSGSNSDFFEIRITNENSKTLIASLCFAYGFRNIQHIVKHFNSLLYDYIEIMACPKGCLNGGGQIKLKEKNPNVLRNEINLNKKKTNEININLIDVEKLLFKINCSFEPIQFLQQYSSIKSTFIHLDW